MFLINLQKSLNSKGIIFSFCGTLSQDLLTLFAENIEIELENYQVKNSIIRNIFAIFVEQSHNLINHSTQLAEPVTEIKSFCSHHSGLIVIGFDPEKEKYYVSSVNMMDSNKVDLLKDKLEKVNSLSKDEVKARYKELRRSGENAHEKGAGLGFLEMAKKVSEPFEYSFIENTENTHFFELKAFI